MLNVNAIEKLINTQVYSTDDNLSFRSIVIFNSTKNKYWCDGEFWSLKGMSLRKYKEIIFDEEGDLIPLAIYTEQKKFTSKYQLKKYIKKCFA